MSDFIEDFYYGNIEPQECATSLTSKVKTSLSELADKEKQLTSLLADKDLHFCFTHTEQFLISCCFCVILTKGGDNMDLFQDLMRESFDPKPNKYKEILKLEVMLNEAEIPHDMYVVQGGFHIFYYGHNEEHIKAERSYHSPGREFVCSVIEKIGSYGNKKDLLEISGLMTKEEYEETGNSVLGNLTAEDVFNRIRNHWLNG